MDDQHNKKDETPASPPYQPTVITPNQTASTTPQPSSQPVSAQPVSPLNSYPNTGPIQPAVSQPTVGTTTTPQQPQQTAEPVTLSGLQGAKKSGKRWLLPVILVIALLLGGSAAAYIQFFQNSPEKLWARAMKNTADGFDQFLELATKEDVAKGTKIDGNLKLTSPSPFDAAFNGQFYEGEGALTADLSGFGMKLDTEVRTIKNENAESPDFYVKIGGLKEIAAMLGALGGSQASSYSKTLVALDDQWFVIDEASLSKLAGSGAKNNLTADLSEEDIKQFTESLSTVFRERFFASSGANAVFTIAEEIGSEDFEGDAAYKLKVTVSKEGFKAFLIALKDAVKSSKLDDVLLQVSGKSLEDTLQFDTMLAELDKADFSKLYAHVWLESHGKFVRNVRVYTSEGKESTNYLDFGLDYTGGDVFPFQMRATIDENGTKGTLSFGIDINKENADSRLWTDVDMSGGTTQVKLTGEIKVEGTDEKVEVIVPKGAKSLEQLMKTLNSLGPNSPSVFGAQTYNQLFFNDDTEIE